MPERFFIADCHFRHRGMVKYERHDGTPIRPEWGRVDREMSDEEADERVARMDEAMISRWNAVVGPRDKVEILGDFAMGRRGLIEVVPRLNGRLRLRSGNHDQFHKDNMQLFEEVSAYKVFSEFLCSHIPVHPSEIKRWKANVHGHLHDGRVMRTNPAYLAWAYPPPRHGPGPSRRLKDRPAAEVIDPDYLCVSAEHTDYTPISMDEVLERLRRQREEA